MLFSEMKRIFKCDNINISERLNTVEASFDIEFQDFPAMEELRNIISIVPTRDIIVLTLKSYSGDIIQITNSQVEECDFWFRKINRVNAIIAKFLTILKLQPNRATLRNDLTQAVR